LLLGWFLLIVRFLRIIPRKVGADFLRCKLFVVLGLEAGIKLKSLTGRASALFLRAGRELGWVCGSRPHSQALTNPDLRSKIWALSFVLDFRSAPPATSIRFVRVTLIVGSFTLRVGRVTVRDGSVIVFVGSITLGVGTRNFR
jgi:hypothetical protein